LGNVGNDITIATIDSITNTIVSVDYANYEIHEGNSYSLADTVACNNTTVKWQITTPDSKTYAHLIFSLTCTGEATFLVTEGSDRTNGYSAYRSK